MEGQDDGALRRIKTLHKNVQYRDGIRDILSILSDADTLATAQTASSKKLLPENKEEAIDIILIYTPDIERFFSYRRITSNFLTQYLHVNKVTLKGQVTHQHLIGSVINLWNEKFPPKPIYEQKNETQVSSKENCKRDATEISSSRFYVKSDEFARHFAEWFYSCLNSINANTSLQKDNEFNASVFCSNASADVYLVNISWSDERHGSGAEDCAKLFKDVVSSFKISFTPNLENGTQALKSAHGLIKVLSCGTLHKERDFIGVFEQEFGLVQSPIDKNWKIFLTKANLKTSCNVSVPSLPPCSVFEIECL